MDLSPLGTLSTPVELADLDLPQLALLQTALSRIGYPVRTIDGKLGPNTSSCWSAFCSDNLLGNPGLVAPKSVAVLGEKVAILEKIEAGPLATEPQVIAAIIAECNALGLTLKAQHAYVIATAYWETNHTFLPVREAYYLKDPEAYLKKTKYHPYYGRGYVQITWLSNYEKYRDILGIDLVNNPDLALQPAVALFILVHGFKLGAFSGHRLADYVNAASTDFIGARHCINGSDRAADIAQIAQKYLSSL